MHFRWVISIFVEGVVDLGGVLDRVAMTVSVMEFSGAPIVCRPFFNIVFVAPQTPLSMPPVNKIYLCPVDTGVVTTLFANAVWP